MTRAGNRPRSARMSASAAAIGAALCLAACAANGPLGAPEETAAPPAQGEPLAVECAPFARALSGLQLTGNAADWWWKADGRYARASTPEVGRRPRLPSLGPSRQRSRGGGLAGRLASRRSGSPTPIGCATTCRRSAGDRRLARQRLDAGARLVAAGAASWGRPPIRPRASSCRTTPVRPISLTAAMPGCDRAPAPAGLARSAGPRLPRSGGGETILLQGRFRLSPIEPMRTASIDRKTAETTIHAAVDLDGCGRYDVATGIGFLDHMLEQLSRHSLIDLTLDGRRRPAHRRPPHHRGQRRSRSARR